MCNAEKELLAHIAPDQLLKSLGGSNDFTYNVDNV
jgi:hypothetical protein